MSKLSHEVRRLSLMQDDRGATRYSKVKQVSDTRARATARW